MSPSYQAHKILRAVFSTKSAYIYTLIAPFIATLQLNASSALYVFVLPKMSANAQSYTNFLLYGRVPQLTSGLLY